MSDRQQWLNVKYQTHGKFYYNEKITGNVNKLKNETEVRISSQNEEEVE